MSIVIAKEGPEKVEVITQKETLSRRVGGLKAKGGGHREAQG